MNTDSTYRHVPLNNDETGRRRNRKRTVRRTRKAVFVFLGLAAVFGFSIIQPFGLLLGIPFAVGFFTLKDNETDTDTDSGYPYD